MPLPQAFRDIIKRVSDRRMTADRNAQQHAATGNYLTSAECEAKRQAYDVVLMEIHMIMEANGWKLDPNE